MRPGLSVGITTALGGSGGSTVQMYGEDSYAFNPAIDNSAVPSGMFAIVDYSNGDPQMPVVLGYGGYVRGFST